MRGLLRAAAFAAAVIAPIAASATLPPANAGTRLVFHVVGHITPKCALERRGSGSVSFGDILDRRTGAAKAADADLDFHLECNAPYTATLTSMNGGLKFDGNGSSGFSALVPYTAIIGLDAPAGGLSLNCDSTGMKGGTQQSGSSSASDCKGRSNRNAYSKGDGKVELTTRGGGLPLLHGSYSDELVLRVAPNV